MIKKEVRNALNEAITPVLKPLGFKKKSTGDGWLFHKDTDFGYNEVSLLIWQHAGYYAVSEVFIIRISALNEVFLPYSNYVIYEVDDTQTFAASLNAFFGGDSRILVRTEDDLRSAAQSLTTILIEKGLPFFEQFQTVEAVDKEFNREDRPPNLFADDITTRPLIGITAAALNKNPDFDYWVSYYQDKVKNDIIKPKYEALVEHLKSTYLIHSS